jgi:hypothetical protein
MTTQRLQQRLVKTGSRNMWARLIIVGCSILASVGIASAQVQVLDHFDCYLAEGPHLQRTVFLRDQFELPGTPDERSNDLRIFRFCNPVQKTTPDGRITPIVHPADHLTMYVLSPQPGIARVVTVRNQFGDQTLHTGPAVILAVPTGKALLPTPAPPPIPRDLDHFKCYTASGKNLNRPLLLKDQFISGLTTARQPFLFCNPVQKTTQNPAGGTTVTPITNPTAHLVCYITTPRSFRAIVQINNQFGLSQLPVFNADILCVPSLKLRWSVVQPPTSLKSPAVEEDSDR